MFSFTALFFMVVGALVWGAFASWLIFSPLRTKIDKGMWFGHTLIMAGFLLFCFTLIFG